MAPNYFKDDEFFCQCNYNCGLGRDDVMQAVVIMANRLRHSFGSPLKISSSVRCPWHNKDVGGANLSFHTAVPGRLKGFAIDLQPIDGNLPKLHQLADEMFPHDSVGFYSWGVHIDCRGYSARWGKKL